MTIHNLTPAEQGRVPLPDIDLRKLFENTKRSLPPEGLPTLINADGVFFLTLSADDRVGIATTVERLIDMLDGLDADPDLEETGGDERWLGWPEGGPHPLAYDSADREEENEHGGGIDDEPQDDDEMEPLLGWSETCSQGVPLGATCGTVAFMDDAEANDGSLDFRGEGQLSVREALSGIKAPPASEPGLCGDGARDA